MEKPVEPCFQFFRLTKLFTACTWSQWHYNALGTGEKLIEVINPSNYYFDPCFLTIHDQIIVSADDGDSILFVQLFNGRPTAWPAISNFYILSELEKHKEHLKCLTTEPK